MIAASTDEKQTADKWLAAELNRTWLIAERALRAFQRAQIRPQPGHPSIAEVEAMLSARRAARRGGDGGPPEDEAELTRLIEEAEAKLPALRRAAPIGQVIQNLDLRPLEIETLMTVMAPHLDAPLADFLALVRGTSSGRRGVDLALVSQLYRLKRAERVALLDAVDPERPLLYWRLIQAAPVESAEAFGSVSHRMMRPTFDLLSVVCGRGELAPDMTRNAELIRTQPTLDDLCFEPSMLAEVEAMCEAARGMNTNAAEFPWIVLWGHAGIGKKTVASKLAAYGGRPLLAFNPMTLEKGMFDDLFPRVQRDALIRGAVIYLGPLPPEFLTNGARDLVRRLQTCKAPLILGIDGIDAPRITSERPQWEMRLRIAPEAVRVQLWNLALPEDCRADDMAIPNLARSFNLTPGEIMKAALEARTIAARDRGRKVTHADVRRGIDRRLRNDIGDFAKRIQPVAKWSDLVLPEEDMERIAEFISRKKYEDKVYNEWGYGGRIGYGKGVIGLFSGPPGTGKTMLAGLIAQELDLDLYQVDLAQVVSKWVGETEKQLAKVFDQAERAHAVLLFDEADSLFAKRTEVKSSNDRYGNMATNYLLQRLEQYTGVAVLTTNNESSLDDALQRRLTLHLHLEIPEADERERLWHSFLPKQAPVEAGIDFQTLAKEFELSGGYIRNAALRAAFLAASHNAPIGMELLRISSALELEDMGRVVWRRSQQFGPQPPAEGGDAPAAPPA
ncbi:MAG: AAA family ATPase [Deltaproteobacteria bacterium]|nr:AAA family ATPase [Deltaproteobacteria bacterium]